MTRSLARLTCGVALAMLAASAAQADPAALSSPDGRLSIRVETVDGAPDEVLERKERFCRLWNALNSLPPAQGRRVDACVILGKSFSEVALAEGVDESAVRRAVERGLENMKKFLKNSR